MYCSTCGVAVAPGLPYCNYCGEKLNTVKGEALVKSHGPKPEILVSSMVVVFVFGLGAISVLMGIMKAVLHFDAAQILVFTVLSFLIMLSIEGVLMRLLFRRNRSYEEPNDAARLKRQTTRELDEPHARRCLNRCRA